MMLIGKNTEGLKWIFCEENFGDRPAPKDVVEAINAVVPMEPKQLPPKQPDSQPAAQPSSAPKAPQPASQPPATSEPTNTAVVEKKQEQVIKVSAPQQPPQ
jgi:hypothetical protein